MVIGEYLACWCPRPGARGGGSRGGRHRAFAVLYWRGIRRGDRGQQLLSLLKALALAVLVVACFSFGSRAVETAHLTVPAGAGLATAIVLSLQGVIYTYDGWNGMTYFSGEVRNPGRDVPRAMVSGVLFVIAIYLLINLAILYVLPMSRMAGDPFVAGTRGQGRVRPRRRHRHPDHHDRLRARGRQRLPAHGAAGDLRHVARWAHAARPSPASTPAARRPIATSRARPVALAFIATGTFDRALALIAFFFVANYLLTFTSVFVLRRREPDTHRPYRVWGYPWTTGIALRGLGCAFWWGSASATPATASGRSAAARRELSGVSG